MCWCIHQHISIFSDKYKLAYVGAEEMLERAQKIIGCLKLRIFNQPVVFWTPSNIPSAPCIGQFVFVTEYCQFDISEKKQISDRVNWFSAIWSVLSSGHLRDALLQTNNSEPHGPSISTRESIRWGTSEKKSEHKIK